MIYIPPLEEEVDSKTLFLKTEEFKTQAEEILIVPALKGEVDSKNDSFLKTEGFFSPCFVTAIR